MPFPHAFLDLFRRAPSGVVETTAEELLRVFQIPAELDLLDKITALSEAIKENECLIKPPLTKGGFDTVRVFEFAPRTAFTYEAAKDEIANGEGSALEFKSSLFCNLVVMAIGGDLKAASEVIIEAALKTICGFLNADGGVLYIGVGDQGNICGIEHDYALCGDRRNRDTWELKARALISDRFKDGPAVSNYIETSFFEEDGRCFCRVKVQKRGKAISVLRYRGRFTLFVRQGNRTVELGIEDIEEFLLGRLSNER